MCHSAIATVHAPAMCHRAIATVQAPAICYCQKLSSADVQSPHGYMGFGATHEFRFRGYPLRALRVSLKSLMVLPKVL